MMFRLFIAAVSILMAVLTGCSGITRRAQMTPFEIERAEALASKAANLNRGLESFKGKGRIRFSDGRIVQSARIFWIGSRKAGLRLQTLNVSGRPAVSMAGDRDCFYFFSHADRRFRKKCAADPDLKHFLGVSVRFSEIESLLYGRVPIRDSKHIFYERGGDGGHILGFETRWGRRLEKIGFAKDMETIRWAEIYGVDQKLSYRIEFKRVQAIDGYAIPFYVRLSGGGAGFELEVERYWPNADTGGASFRLEPV